MDLKNKKFFKNTKYEILTKDGFKDFDGIFIGENKNKILLQFESKKSLLCTSKHKLMVNTNDYKFANELKIGDILFNNEKISNIQTFINDELMYEFLEIKDNHTYFANDILCHQCIIIDEMAHIEDHLIEEFWASVIPVISSSKKGTTKIFAVSTPRGTGNKFHEIYTAAERGEANEGSVTWHAEKIDWWEIPGRGKKWKADMMAALGGDEHLFNQEFNNTFIETGESAIDGNVIENFRLQCRDPIQTFENGHYKVWKEPQKNHIYGIGVDVCEGIGKAASVAQILDFTDLTNIEQVAIYHDNLIHPLQFAEVLYRIGSHWGRPPMIIERNNCGAEVINSLNEKHGYNNIVSHNPENLKYGDIRMGVYSHTNTKYTGIMNMRYWSNTLQVLKLYDIATVQEIQTFVRYPNGTWKAKQGHNIWDDRVMSLVWALFVLEEAICERYYEIVAFDDKGKPSKIRSYTIDAPTMYKLDEFYQHDESAPMPTFIGMSPNSGSLGSITEVDFNTQGWKKL